MAGFKAYFTEKGIQVGAQVVLDKAESNHLIAVLRARVGAEVSVFNGIGGAWICKIIEANSKGAVLFVESIIDVPERPFEVILVQALPKAGSMESIIRRATEIGVSKIIPLLTERTEVRLDASRAEKKLKKWLQIAIEACKQSGNFMVPQVLELQRVNEVIPCYSQGLRLVASLEDRAEHLSSYLGSKTEGPVVLLVGPEGDFTEKEYALLAENGFLPLKLASNVLTVETAVIYGLSVIDYEFARR